MSITSTLRQNTTKNRADVVSVTPIGDGLTHICVTTRRPTVGWQPGQAIAVVVDPDGKTMRDRWRHYTVRRATPDSNELELLVVDRGPDSPAGRWIASLNVGASFTFMGPGGRPTLSAGAPAYVLTGDRSSIASIAAMTERLLTDERAPNIDVIVGTPNPDLADLTVDGDVADNLRIRWVRAADAPALRTELPAALPTTLPPGTRAYVTGEMKMMQTVRSTLQRAGVARRAIGSHAHWTPGRRGM
ncbi:MAG: siderophore-interacting protein [Actinomycetota bacterium]